MVATSSTSDGRRRLSWPKLLAWLLAFALGPAFFSVLVVHGDEVESFAGVEDVVRAEIADTLLMLAIACFVVWRLGWWDVVLHERRRARRWVWIVPAALVSTSVATIDYSRLASAGAKVTVMLVVATLLIGAAEELMFRGIVLQAFRDRHREGVAAVATALLFGALHLIAGPLAGVSSAIGGYLYYASRRVSGGLLVPIVAHAAWDFSILSNSATSDPADSASGPLVLFLVSIALLVLLVIRRGAVGVPPAGRHASAEPALENAAAL